MRTHEPCPDCGHTECLTIFEDGSSYCHSTCDPPFKPSKDFKGKETTISQQELKLEVRPYRGVKKEVAEFYGIMTGIDDKGGEVTRVYPYPHMPKTRVLPKDFSSNKGFKNNKLFGMDKFNAGSSKFLTIVEGEDDVPSAYQMLGSKHHVVGMAGGAAHQVLKDPECKSFIEAYQVIILATDGDDAGNTAADIFSRTYPNKCYRVSMTKYKDPNDYLVNGCESDFLYAWINRTKYTPENILNTTEQFLSLYRDTPEQTYVPTGIEALDEKIKGIMRGYFTVFKAETGVGKTEVMRFIEHSLVKQGEPIAFWHLEETKLRSLLGLVTYEVDDNVTQKDLIEEKGLGDKVEEAITALTKDELLYQFYIRDGDGPDDLIEQIRYFSEACGVNYIFMEPIQDIVAGRSDAGKEEMLADLSVRLSKLCAELNIAIVTIAHTNDDGEIKYCRMIGQRAGIIVSLDRDKSSEDEDLRNTTYLTVEKNRPCSVVGFGGSLEFNSEKFTLKEKVF